MQPLAILGCKNDIFIEEEGFTLTAVRRFLPFIEGVLTSNPNLCRIHTPSLREHLCIHEIFIVDQNKSYFLRKYQKFSIKKTCGDLFESPPQLIAKTYYLMEKLP